MRPQSTSAQMHCIKTGRTLQHFGCRVALFLCELLKYLARKCTKLVNTCDWFCSLRCALCSLKMRSGSMLTMRLSRSSPRKRDERDGRCHLSPARLAVSLHSIRRRSATRGCCLMGMFAALYLSGKLTMAASMCPPGSPQIFLLPGGFSQPPKCVAKPLGAGMLLREVPVPGAA